MEKLQLLLQKFMKLASQNPNTMQFIKRPRLDDNGSVPLLITYLKNIYIEKKCQSVTKIIIEEYPIHLWSFVLLFTQSRFYSKLCLKIAIDQVISNNPHMNKNWQKIENQMLLISKLIFTLSFLLRHCHVAYVFSKSLSIYSIWFTWLKHVTIGWLGQNIC